MIDDMMTRNDLMSELALLRQRVAELEGGQAIPDASGEKAVEQALRESEEKYRLVVQKAHEAILIAQDGMQRFVNPAAARIWGYSEEELLSRPLIEFLHPDDRDMVLDRSLRRARGEKLPSRYAHRVVTKDGETRWVEIDSAAISWEDKPAVLVFAIDVTERKQMEEAIKERDEQYRALVEESFDGIMITKETKIIFVNSRLCQMLGYSKEEMEGMDYRVPAHPDYREVAHERALARMRGESLLPHYELKFQRKDGSVFDAEIHSRAMEIQGAPGVQVWIRDISERKEAEEALQESEKRYRAIFDNAPTGINMNKWGSVLQVNSAWKKMLGYSEDELRELTPLDITHPDDAVMTSKNHDALVRGDIDSYRIEKRYIRKDGQVLWGDLSVSAVRDEAGNYRNSVVIVTDITDKKRAQEELLASEERYRGLFEDSIDGVFVTAEDGTLVAANNSFVRMFGYAREELIGQNVTKLYVNPDDRRRYASEIKKTGAVKEYPLRLRKKDGTEIDTVHTTTIRRGKGGEALGYRGIVRDITELKGAEKALEIEREQLLSIFDSINEVISVIDLQTYEILYANKLMTDRFGADLVGHRCYKQLHGLDRPCDHCTKEIAISLHGEPYRWDYHNPTTNKDYLATDRIIRWTDGRDAKFHLGIDVTERKKSEEQREELRKQLFQAQKMESIGTLAGGIAHDFNNLLTVVLGYAELLFMDMDEDNPSRDDLQRIIAAASSGASLVQRLLTYSRQAETSAEPLDVKHEIRQVKDLLLRTIPKMISLDLRLAEDVASFYGDSKQIQQVVMNLALNAADAMPDGGALTIEAKNAVLDDAYCATHPRVQPGNYVLLTISDTGRGMDRQTMERMYDPFFSTKARGSDRGTGLGLAVVHSIVEQHRGHVTCDSEPGKGTRFKLYFPAMRTEPQPEDIPEKPAAPGGTETILLVDDEALVRDLGQRILTRAGYKVLTASNGREALDMYRKALGQISLVVLDLVMPEMGGRQCIPELSKVDPRVKIVVSTGYSSDDDESEQTSSTVPLGFIRKPFAVSSLLQTVREVLDRA